jgi:hypothetical protein
MTESIKLIKYNFNVVHGVNMCECVFYIAFSTNHYFHNP